MVATDMKMLAVVTADKKMTRAAGPASPGDHAEVNGGIGRAPVAAWLSPAGGLAVIDDGSRPISSITTTSPGAPRAPGLRRPSTLHDHDEMDSGLIELARPRRGHFDLGTGFHGDVWLDLDAVFLRPSLLRPHVELLAERLRQHRIDAVCGPLEGGAFLAYALADSLGVAFLPAYRDQPGQQGTAPAYRLPDVPGGIGRIRGWRMAIVDDAINAGTAVRACAGLLLSRGAVPVAAAALLSLGPASAAVAERISVPLYTVGAVQSQAWPAARCPLCAGDIPFTEPPPPD